MNFLGIGSAIGWVQCQLRGGLNNLLWTTGGYAAVVVSLIVLTVRLNPAASAATLYNWTIILLAAQAGLLILFAGTRISASIRADVTSNLIESHRLMPIPPASAVAGYIWGPSSQALCLAAATFVIGAVAANAAGISLDRWVIPNFVLAVFAAFTATLAAFTGFLAAGAVGIIIFLVIIFATSEGASLEVLPGAVLLAGPIVGQTIFEWRSRTVDLGWPIAVSIAAQVLVGSILFLGAVRKYRRGDQPALGVGLGLCLLAAWVLLSAVAINFWAEIRPFFLRTQLGGDVQLMGSLIAGMLLAIVPLTNAAKETVGWLRRRTIDPFLPRRPLPPAAIAVAAAAMLLVLPCIAPPANAEDLPRLAATAVVLLAHSLAVAFIMQISQALGMRFGVLLLWLVLAWGGPIMFDAVRSAMNDANAFGPGMSFSPAGSIITLWRTAQPPIWTGIIFQAGVALTLGAVWLVLARGADREFSETRPPVAHGN